MNPNNSDETCSSCRFYDDQYGTCKRFPPKLVKGFLHEGWHSPKVTSYDWCGEYQRPFPPPCVRADQEHVFTEDDK